MMSEEVWFTQRMGIMKERISRQREIRFGR
jgi:hypothetical protein